MLRRPPLAGARRRVRGVDRLDRALDRRPQAGDLGGGGRLRLALADAAAGGKREREAGALADLARPYRDAVAVEEGATLRQHPRFLLVALGWRGVEHNRVG